MIREALGVVSALLVILAAVAVVAVTDDGRRAPAVAQEDAVPVVRADPELAVRTVDRMQLFRAGSLGSSLSLDADELTAVLRHAVPGVVPGGVVAPRIGLEDGQVVIDAQLATRDFGGSAPIAAALGALPDTMEVHLRGRLHERDGRLVFDIGQARVGGVPLPPSVVASIVSALAGGDLGLSARDEEASLSVRWPDRWTRVAVVGDRLVLERDERFLDHAVDGSDIP